MSEVIRNVALDRDHRFLLVVGDLLQQPVDAIVNAANAMLAHGGGVAGAIARAAGIRLQEESDRTVRERGPIPTGEAVVTTAGALPFKGVIHAVGPRHGEGDEERKVARAVSNALLRAHEQGWSSVAFPAISSGIFAVPLELCARGYVTGVLEHFRDVPESTLREVRCCLLPGALVDLVAAEVDRRMGREADG